MRKKNTTNEQLHTQPQFRLKPVCAAVLLAFAVQTAQANPLGGTVAAGQASFATSGNTLTVTNTPGTIINWQGFSIGANEITRFAQQSASSAVLNRVISNNPSSILGTLQSNGRVFLINPGGIVFGAGAVVDVAGMVASTLNLSNADFLAGRNHYTQVPGAGNVSNAGNITAQNGGQIYLIAPDVENTGVITAPNGEILLAAGHSVDLVSTNDPNLRVSITAPAGDATNVGQLIAQSGSLGLFGTVVRNSGTVSADSATMQGGKIVFRATQRVEAGGVISAQGTGSVQGVGGGEIKLLADMQTGTVNVTGTLDASAPVSGNGGFIETSAAHVKVADTARITTSALQGSSGMWLLDPYDFTIALTGGDISGAALTAALGTGAVTIQTTAVSASCTGAICGAGNAAGNGDIFVNDTVSWSSTLLTLNAYRNIEINAVMDATGTAGLNMTTGGTVNVGMNPDGSFKGMVNLASTTSLTINANPYTIINSLGNAGSMTGTDLQGMNGGLDGFSVVGYYALGSDIDASLTSGWNSGAGFAPVGNWVSQGTNFNGQFDGLGHSVSNLYINRPTTPDHVGLFGDVYLGAVRNVGLLNASVTGQSAVGALVGVLGGSISNSSSSGTVNGLGGIGGLVGSMGGGGVGSINNSFSSSNVTGNGTAGIGGLVGSKGGGSISYSTATGNVSGLNAYWVGGLAGINSGGTISYSSASGSVDGASAVGGLVGQNQATVSNSSATGNVTGTYSVGGLAGINNYGTISNNSSATGKVSGSSYIGGLVGYNLGGSIISGFWNPAAGNTVSGFSDVGGLVGVNQGSISSSVAGGSGGAGADVTGGIYVGGLVGYNNGSISNNSSASGNVSGSNYSYDVGGLVGFNINNISDSSATGSVSGGDHVGGLVGANSSYDQVNFGNVSNSFATGSVTGVSNVGGLVGGNDYPSNSITANSYATGNVTGTSSVGGLAGSSDGIISDAHASGNVTGIPGSGTSGTLSNALGGLVGTNWGTISSSYASGGSVAGNSNVGGLVGYNNGSISNNSYASGNVSGILSVGGLVGYNYGSINNSYVSIGSVTGTSDVGGLVGVNYGVINNAHYNINGVLINGGYYVTLGGLYDDLLNFNSVGQYTDWFDGGLLTPLNIANYATLTPAGVNSYSISTADGMKDLLGFADNPVLSFSLGSNIDLSTTSVPTPGLYIPELAGSFDGAGHTISNLNLNQSFTSNLGLFGHVAAGSTVNNVALVDATVIGGNNVGALAGLNDGTINNSSVSANTNPSVIVTGNYNVGGLVGNNNGSISSSHISNGTVAGGGGSSGGVGGLVGLNNYNGSISNSYVSSGSVTGISNLGGLVGLNYGVINNSHYNVDFVTINGTNAVTQYGLYNVQYQDWLTGGLTPLNIANYSGAGQSLELIGGTYTISSPQGMMDLLAFADAGYSFILANNITLPSGYNVPYLAGSFDGGASAGYTLSGLNVSLPNNDVGLFGHVAAGSVVSNVGLLGAIVSGRDRVGALVGWNEGNISNSYVSGDTVSGNSSVGGLVGYNSRGNISYSYVDTGTVVTGNRYVGGLVGSNYGSASYGGAIVSGIIDHSYVDNGTVAGSGSSASDIGGLVGHNSGGYISYSHVDTGSVTGTTNIGGLVGYNDGGEGGGINISDSNVIASNVTGTRNVGGLVGYNNRSTIDHSFVDSTFVTGVLGGASSSPMAIGGLVGNNYRGTISNSYVNSGSVTGGSSVGGLVGNNDRGTIEYSYVSNGTVSGRNRVGGLVGNMNASTSSDSIIGTISNSYVSNGSVGSVTGNSSVGGLVGNNNGGSISYSYVSNGTINGGDRVGGLVGNMNIASNYNSSLKGSISESYVSNVRVSGGNRVGGLVGRVNGASTVDGGTISGGSISKSYVNSGSVTGSNSVGGLVGYNDGSVSYSYASSGLVSGSNSVGGVVGYNDSRGSVSDSFWDTAVIGGSLTNSIGYDYFTTGGIDNGAIGLTTAQMMNSANFINYYNVPTASTDSWDFGGTWWMSDGNTRPFLQSEWSTTIINAHQLQLMAMNPTTLGASYTLANNLDLGSELSNPSGMWGSAGFVPVGNGSMSFTGQFDGFGNTISSLFINRPLESNVGLFGVVSGTGAVNNVGMVGGNVTGSYYVGGLVGSNYGTINNSSASGNVTGSYEVGGLVGYNASGGTSISGPWGAHINNSYVSSGSVMGTSDVGGLVGANYGVIKNAHYNINGVLINGFNQVTRYGLYGTQYLSWFNGGLLTPLDIANYSGLGGSLEWNGSTYTIKDVQGMQDLLGFADDPAAYSFSLTASISLPSGLYIPYLAGSFDGGSLSGFTISNLNVNQLYNSNLGLFGHIALGSTVSNVALVDVTVTGNNNVGGLAGSNAGNISGSYVNNVIVIGNTDVGGLIGYNSSTISGSHVSGGSVTGSQYVGGLVGYNDGGSIDASDATASVTGDSYVGGLAGRMFSGVINFSHATGDVIGTGDYVGGLVGSAEWQFGIYDSYATGKVTSILGNDVGGLVGSANSASDTIAHSYAIGKVAGASYVGGLVGYNWDVNIDSSYATGNVTGTGDYVGGLVGYNGGSNYAGGSISNSYASGNVSGSHNVGGLVGYNDTAGVSVTGTGTTAIITPWGGRISNSYSSSGSVASTAVSGSANVGGLVGYNSGSISNSYASNGSVSSSGALNIGGLVGNNDFYGGSISNSFWNMQTTVLMNAVGFGSGAVTNATGLDTAGMMTMSNFTGWNITDAGGSTTAVWRIYEGNTTPLLASFLKPLTVTLGNDSKTYDGLAYVGGNGGVIYSDANAPLSSTLSGTLYGGSANGAVNAGGYIISASGLYSSQQGYDISYVDGSLVIGKANATVTANSDLSKTYNGLSQSVSGFSASGLVNGESASVLTGVIAGGSGTNAGTYASAASGTDGNYNLTFVNGSLVIGKASATVTANSDTTKIYNGLSQSVSGFSASGLVNGESASVLTGVIAGGSGTNAGSYLSTASGTDGNYNLTFVDGSLVIGKAALSLNAVTDSRIYNGTTTSVGVVTFTGLQTGDSIIATQSFDSRNAGTRNLSVTGYTVNDGNGGLNYFAPTLNTAMGSITPASLTVTADYTSKILNSSDPLLTYMVSGLKLGDTVDTTLNTLNVNGGGALARLPGEAVGAYPINQGTLGLISTNYTMTYVGAAFTVLPPISLPPIGINEIVNISLLLGTPDTGSAQSTSSEDEERKPKPEDVVAADTNPADGTTASPLLVCPM